MYIYIHAVQYFCLLVIFSVTHSDSLDNTPIPKPTAFFFLKKSYKKYVVLEKNTNGYIGLLLFHEQCILQFLLNLISSLPDMIKYSCRIVHYNNSVYSHTFREKKYLFLNIEFFNFLVSVRSFIFYVYITHSYYFFVRLP